MSLPNGEECPPTSIPSPRQLVTPFGLRHAALGSSLDIFLVKDRLQTESLMRERAIGSLTENHWNV